MRTRGSSALALASSAFWRAQCRTRCAHENSVDRMASPRMTVSQPGPGATNMTRPATTKNAPTTKTTTRHVVSSVRLRRMRRRAAVVPFRAVGASSVWGSGLHVGPSIRRAQALLGPPGPYRVRYGRPHRNGGKPSADVSPRVPRPLSSNRGPNPGSCLGYRDNPRCESARPGRTYPPGLRVGPR